MLDKYLRELKEKLLIPVTRLLFSSTSPNTITIVAGIVGLLCAASAATGDFGVSLICWMLNRTLDGLDGVIARQFNKQSDFGGYLDIVVDFTIYALVPIGQASYFADSELWVLTGVMLGTFFVNAGGLFQLAAILEKQQAGASKSKELTTVTMPDGLIEGTETVVFFTLFLAFPQHIYYLYGLFSLGVTITILQRVLWASRNLDRPPLLNISKETQKNE